MKEGHPAFRAARDWSRAHPHAPSAAALAMVLALAVGIRAQFFRAFPDPFATPDTWSYLTGTYGMLLRGDLDLFAARTPGLPLFAYALLAATGRFAAITLAQGALTIGAAVSAYLTVRSLCGGLGRWPAVIAAGLLALNAHLLFWEHHLMTECLYSATLMFMLCTATATLARPSVQRAAACGLLAGLSVLIRPQGLPVALLVIGAMLWSTRGLGRRRRALLSTCLVLGPVVLLGGWAARNQARHGFFGLTDLTDLQLFGVTARWVDLERPTHVAAKLAIAPQIHQYRRMPDDVNWVQYNPDGPAARIYKFHRDNRNEAHRTMRALSWEAIRSHPIEFAKRGLATTWKLVRSRPDRSPCSYICEMGWEHHWSELAEHRNPSTSGVA